MGHLVALPYRFQVPKEKMWKSKLRRKRFPKLSDSLAIGVLTVKNMACGRTRGAAERQLKAVLPVRWFPPSYTACPGVAWVQSSGWPRCKLFHGELRDQSQARWSLEHRLHRAPHHRSLMAQSLRKVFATAMDQAPFWSLVFVYPVCW